DSANSLAFNNVLDLHEDREGMIWIGTDGGGLNRFNPVTREFHRYRHDPADPGSISSNTVLAIAEDSRGFYLARLLGRWT
ncbi:MAG: two-component regulator propeller domain-containing protein, partial [Cellvibrio sp.]